MFSLLRALLLRQPLRVLVIPPGQHYCRSVGSRQILFVLEPLDDAP